MWSVSNGLLIPNIGDDTSEIWAQACRFCSSVVKHSIFFLSSCPIFHQLIFKPKQREGKKIPFCITNLRAIILEAIIRDTFCGLWYTFRERVNNMRREVFNVWYRNCRLCRCQNTHLYCYIHVKSTKKGHQNCTVNKKVSHSIWLEYRFLKSKGTIFVKPPFYYRSNLSKWLGPVFARHLASSCSQCPPKLPIVF